MSAQPSTPPTRPMLTTLGDAIERGGRVSRTLYPYGQMRMILQGLMNRGLIDYEAPDAIDRGPLVITEAGRIVYATRPEGARS